MVAKANASTAETTPGSPPRGGLPRPRRRPSSTRSSRSRSKVGVSRCRRGGPLGILDRCFSPLPSTRSQSTCPLPTDSSCRVWRRPAPFGLTCGGVERPATLFTATRRPSRLSVPAPRLDCGSEFYFTEVALLNDRSCALPSSLAPTPGPRVQCSTHPRPVEAGRPLPRLTDCPRYRTTSESESIRRRRSRSRCFRGQDSM
jgi:hypothetical protein